MTHLKGKSKFKTFKRLLKDQSGNTIIFVGASLIPLLALIGGGVDASRGYMAKARLQQACDAATLAGRRAVGDGTFDANAQLQANRLFRANFPTNFLGAVNTSFTPTSRNNGNIVVGVATTEIPTIIMRIFGNDELTLNAECEASLDVANADITMILDTTGSMRQSPDGNTDFGTDSNGFGLPGSRIVAMADAAKSFYDVLETATSTSNARIRYGFVPYTSSINVGHLLVNNSGTSLLIGDTPGDTHTYPSRRAIYEVPGPPIVTITPVTETTSDTQVENTTEEYKASNRRSWISILDCQNYGLNVNERFVNGFTNRIEAFRFNGGSIPTQPLSPEGDVVTVVDGNKTTTYEYSFGRQYGATLFVNGTPRNRCDRNVKITTVTTTTTTTNTTTTVPGPPIETFDPTIAGATFKRFEYRNLDLDVYDFVQSLDPANPEAVRPSENALSTIPTDRWTGCIEERTTVAADDLDISFNSLTGISPGGASDLDIDGIPTNDATRWRAIWPGVSYNRVNDAFTLFSSDAVTINGQAVRSSCPQPAALLSELTKTEFDNYIDGLKPQGLTYHDLGMIWGARISSPNGIFQTNVNEVAPNNGFVSRNIIFLTDGTLVPSQTAYTSYGTEHQNPRIAPLGSNVSELRARHTARFLAVCEYAKGEMGIRVFVIAFGTGLTAELQQCASQDSAFHADDAAELNDRFVQIASNIADLRLTK